MVVGVNVHQVRRAVSEERAHRRSRMRREDGDEDEQATEGEEWEAEHEWNVKRTSCRVESFLLPSPGVHRVLSFESRHLSVGLDILADGIDRGSRLELKPGCRHEAPRKHREVMSEWRCGIPTLPVAPDGQH